MPNPNISPGVLNRLRASVVIPAFSQLNVTSPYLGRAGISLGFSGAATVLIDAMTGVVTSPEPYLQFNAALHLLKSQAFANAWKSQLESNTVLGDITIRPDAITMQPFQLSNASIVSVDGLDFSGQSAEFVIHLGGSYNINSQLWP